MAAPYYDFSKFLRKHFPFKVQKIAINAGFSCPNRDGTKGVGGCTYCNNQTFNPGYCQPSESIAEQLEKGKQFFARKYPEMKYLAYFQAYTNTYGELEELKRMYDEALRVDDVVGIIIGTRPDCMPDSLLDHLQTLSRHTFVLIEYGAETSHNETLRLINRGHAWEDTVNAVQRTAQKGILCGLHLILGLPGETAQMMLATADAISRLPIATVKLHQLQLIRGTTLARQATDGEIRIRQFTVEQYIGLCLQMIEHIRADIAIERFVSQSPDNLLISPRWGMKNYEFTNKLTAEILKKNILQGSSLGQGKE